MCIGGVGVYIYIENKKSDNENKGKNKKKLNPPRGIATQFDMAENINEAIMITYISNKTILLIMPSFSDIDDELENMIIELLPRFDNNRSKIIRESIRCLYSIEIEKGKRNVLINMFEAITLFTMGCGLFVFAISMFFNFPLLMATAIILLFISGLLIMILTVINNKKIRGDAA